MRSNLAIQPFGLLLTLLSLSGAALPSRSAPIGGRSKWPAQRNVPREFCAKTHLSRLRSPTRAYAFLRKESSLPVAPPPARLLRADNPTAPFPGAGSIWSDRDYCANLSE